MIDGNMLKKIKNYNIPSMQEKDIQNLSKKLDVNFSDEFKELSKLANFEYFHYFNINNLNLDKENSVIGDTLRLRETSSLPHDTLFLCEDDSSCLLLKCLGNNEEIYWIALEDYENYCQNKELQFNPTIFTSFPIFFEFLINEEEKRHNTNSNT